MAELKVAFIPGSAMLEHACAHFRDFYNSRGAQIQLEKLEIEDPVDVKEAVTSVEHLQAVRLGPEMSLEWLALMPVQPLKVNQFGVADAFVCRDGRWEPTLLLEEALRDVIVHRAKNLDMREAAYIIGEGSCLRIVAGVALSLGFRRVFLVGEHEDDLQVQQEWLQRLFLGADLACLHVHRLTLQTMGASLLINTLDLNVRPEISADLAYFNFMKRDGLVMDLQAGDGSQAMLEEATRAELRAVPAHEVSGRTELRLARALKLESLAAPEEYLASWEERLKSIHPKNPPSV